jgi:hypothetical protein
VRATAKDRQSLALFGVTVAEADRIRAAQGGVCFVCRKPRQLNRDHDHLTGEFRGFLCMLHNKGLALFQDDPALLERAVDYLRENPVVRALGERRFGRTGRSTRKWRTKREKRERMAWVDAHLLAIGYTTERRVTREKAKGRSPASV